MDNVYYLNPEKRAAVREIEARTDYWIDYATEREVHDFLQTVKLASHPGRAPIRAKD